MKLPIAAFRLQSVDPIAPSQEAMKNAPDLEGVRVLLVDDETDTLDLLTYYLQNCGAHVMACTSSGEALKIFKQWRPDVLVSDIGMPGEDGYSFVRKVRSLSPEEGGRVPALALTAYAKAEDRVGILSAGFQLHISKPVDPAQLATIIAGLIGRTGQTD